jgi:hypothetical protein
MILARVTFVLAALFLTGCGDKMILYNAQTGECDEMPKAMAYAMGGGLFAATQGVDAWRCEGVKGGDKARTEKPGATK